ncbi:hypothetical protein SCA6_003338 [Theobroma cacao]
MYIYSSFRFFSEEPCFQPRLSLMHPRSILFDGKFRLGNIFPGNKHALRLFSSDNIPSPSITELLSKQRWNKLKSHLQNVSPSTLLQQLLDSKTDPDLTLRYFRWSEKEFNLSHSLELSCKLLHSLANAKRYPKVRSFLHGFVKNENSISVPSVFHAISICGDSFCANSIIADMLVLAYVENMKTRLGFEAFKRAGDYAFKLSVTSCNPLLSALVKENEIGDLDYVYKEMIRRRVEVNVISFNIIINGMCKVGKLNKARDAIQDMKAWGFLPDVFTYNALINGYCKKGGIGKMYKADAILKEMIESEVRPNEITFNILIDGFSLNVRTQMEKDGRRANVVTYNVLIKGFCKKGKLEDANGLLNEMLEKGLIPNRTTYEIVKEEMVEKGFVPDIEGHLYSISAS